jgi:hypothetical protein
MSATLISDNAVARKRAKAAILYDRLETMLAANLLVDRLSFHASGCSDCVVNSWRFDLLEQGHEGAAALRETSDVGLMVVAIGEAQALRDWPEDWLSHWATSRKDVDAALAVVLLGSANRIEATSAVITPLRRLAEENQLSLLILDDTSAPELQAVQATSRHRNCSPFQQYSEAVQQLPEIRSAAG